MAYVSVADWKPEHVTEWLKGLDAVILPYIHSFVNNEVDGQQLLSLRPDDLQHRGITKVGHQEIILEAVEHLRNFHYELDRENIQLHALRLSCQAHSLHRVLSVEEEEQASVSPGGNSKVQSVSTQTLADVAGVIACIKPLALWLDRPPFCGLPIYQELRTQLLSHGLNIAICAQRDRFAENPVDDIRQHCQLIAKLADEVIQEFNDPLILQPASLDLATIRKRAGDDVGFYLAPSLSGAHQIIEVKLQGPAHQSGKVEEGDEIVQVNYQTVVGWRLKAVWPLLQEASTAVYLTLKKRPRHSNVYGQIYIKPFRLPSRKRNPPFLRWHENLPSPRPELLTIPHFELPLPTTRLESNLVPLVAPCSSSDTGSSDEDDSAFLPGGDGAEGEVATSSPCSVRLLLPRPRSAVQRRATVSGSSPTAKHPPPGLEQLWAEIDREMQKRGLPTPKNQVEPAELRGKSGSAISLAIRPNTVLGSESSESDHRSPLSPVPSSLRSKIYQTASNPARTSPQSPKTQKPKPPPINTRPLPQSPPVTPLSPDPYVIPSHSLSAHKTTLAYNVPTHEAPKLSSPIIVPFHCAPKLAPSPTVRSHKHQATSSLHTLDILPSSSNYMSSSVYPMPVIVIDDDGMGDTLHERAIDCSPVPPPRPASSLRGLAARAPQVTTQSATRNIVARTMSRTKHKMSPKVDRKKNNLLSKGRNVSCKQLGEVECDGWLLQRARAAAGASWNRAWFVLKDTSLYGFPSPEAKKADKLISMPGFTAAAAPEVKSRQFAFKVYHTGTVFYFAAGCAEELSRWLGCLSSATLGVRTDTNTPYFSETEDEEQQPTRPPARAASSGNVSGEHESKGDERRFGSLRRLAGSWRNDEGATSLDRKYIPRLLRQEAAVPVPTAQFRSYRRVDRSGTSGLDPSRTRTLPSRLGSQHQQRVMSVDSVANAGSTSSLPLQQVQNLQRDSMGSSPHLATVHEPATPSPADKPPRRMLRLFSPGLSRKFGGGSKSADVAGSFPSPPPTLLGSPKLHRALFRGRRQSPQSSKATVVQPRRIPPTLPEDSAPPIPVVVSPSDTLVPDYPGLEYPPVFEPGTYTLNPEAREQFRSSPNTRPIRTNRTLMLLPKPKDACWPTQSMNLSHPRGVSQRRIRLEPPEGQAPRRPPDEALPSAEHRRSLSNQEVVLISSLDLLSSTDV